MRKSVIDELKLLSSARAQMEYEKSLSGAAGLAPRELISVFCDDLYHPKSDKFVDAFSEDELKELAHLYGLMSEVVPTQYVTVAEMLKSPGWRKVVDLSKQLMSRMKST